MTDKGSYLFGNRRTLRAARASGTLEPTDIAEQLLHNRQLFALRRRLARAEIDDLPVLYSIVGEGDHLIISVEPYSKNLPLRFDGIEEGGLFDPAGDIIIAVALKSDAGG